MNCCSVITKTFADALTTTVPFTGATPKVKILYWDAIGGAYRIGPSTWTVITIAAGMVAVDHGGPATGIIQLIQ